MHASHFELFKMTAQMMIKLWSHSWMQSRMNYCVEEEEDHIIVSSRAVVVTKRRTRFLSLFTVFENQNQKVLGFKMEFLRNSAEIWFFRVQKPDFYDFFFNPSIDFRIFHLLWIPPWYPSFCLTIKLCTPSIRLQPPFKTPWNPMYNNNRTFLLSFL